MVILDIIFYAFVVVVIIQTIFYTLFFGRFAFFKQKEKPSSKNIPVSIIVCAKNEAENLKIHLPAIIDQDYPDFEIVLINDSSNDNTLEVINEFANLHANIKVVDVKATEAFWGNKKYGLTLGIKASTHDYLLFTDADCQPVSKQWIKNMMAQFNDEKSIVLGYGAHSKVNGSFLNKLIRFETLVTAVNYFSFALAGLPYMGVGRNLAYTKKEFFNANGFINHIKVRSGDDDLFVNQVANSKNVALSLSQNSFTSSTSKKSLKTWITQKRRHISTAKHYKRKHKILLSLLFVSNLLFWLLATTLFTTLFMWQIVLALFFTRILFQNIIFISASKKLNEKDLIYFIPLLEIFLVISQLTIFIINLISKPDNWK